MQEDVNEAIIKLIEGEIGVDDQEDLSYIISQISMGNDSLKHINVQDQKLIKFADLVLHGIITQYKDHCQLMAKMDLLCKSLFICDCKSQFGQMDSNAK